MKVKISFEGWEKKLAAIAVAAFLQVLPGVKVKESGQSTPVNIIYLTTRKQKGSNNTQTND